MTINDVQPIPLMQAMDHLDPLVKDPKAVEDFSELANEVIPKAESLARAGRMGEAIESLLAVEKKARFAFDGLTCSRMLCTIASLFREANDWEGLFQAIPGLIKKRSQLKRPVADLVQLCIGWLKTAVTDLGMKHRFIQVLADVTEGKIFVEADRARIKRYESQLREAEGNTALACVILQEEQVEIIGAMEAREKTDYILDQMRLVLGQNDYVRLPIIAKKINPKILNKDKTIEDLKIKYYEYLVIHHLHEEEYLEVSNCYREILATPSLAPEQALKSLVGAVMNLLLSPGCDAQRASLQAMLAEERRRFDDLVPVRDLARAFLSTALVQSVDPAIQKLDPIFVGQSPEFVARGIPAGSHRLALLEKRIVQFNLTQVLSKFYSRIRLAKLASILRLTPAQCESEVIELVSNKALQLKIDRPAGIVWFHPKLSPQAKLDLWSGNINKALDLVESTSNLVQKEIMLHEAKEKIRLQFAKDQAALA